MSIGKFSMSPRLSIVGQQGGMDFQNPTNPDKRIRISGYNLLNVTLNYQVVKSFSFFAIVNNALNSKYVCTNQGVTQPSNYYMYGSPQQPIRISGGFKLNL